MWEKNNSLFYKKKKKLSQWRLPRMHWNAFYLTHQITLLLHKRCSSGMYLSWNVPQPVCGDVHYKWYQRVSAVDIFLNVDTFAGDSCHENSLEALWWHVHHSCSARLLVATPTTWKQTESPAVSFLRLPGGRNALHGTPEPGQSASSHAKRCLTMLFFCVSCFWVVCMCLSIENRQLWGGRVDGSPGAYGQADRKLVLGIDDKQVNLLWVIFWKQSLLYLFINIIFFSL